MIIIDFVVRFFWGQFKIEPYPISKKKAIAESPY